MRSKIFVIVFFFRKCGVYYRLLRWLNFGSDRQGIQQRRRTQVNNGKTDSIHATTAPAPGRDPLDSACECRTLPDGQLCPALLTYASSSSADATPGDNVGTAGKNTNRLPTRASCFSSRSLCGLYIFSDQPCAPCPSADYSAVFFGYGFVAIERRRLQTPSTARLRADPRAPARCLNFHALQALPSSSVSV